MDVPKLRFLEFNWRWENTLLQNVINSLEAGVSVNSQDSCVNADEIGVLKTSCIKNGNFLPKENKRVLLEEVYRVRKPVKRDTLIISRMNTPQLVGELGYIDKDYDNLFLPDRLWELSPNENIVNSKWLSILLTTPKYKFFIRSLGTGTSGSMKNIAKTDFLDLVINIPNLYEQKKMAMFFDRIDKKLQLQQEKIDLLKEQKKGYMQKIFSQELRFKDENEQEFSKWKSILVKDVLSLNLREVPKPTTAYTRLGLRSHAKGTFHELVSDVDSVNMDTLYEVHNGDFIINITFAWEQALAIADKEDHGKLVSHRFPTYRFKENHEKNFYKHFFTTKYFKYCLGNASPGGAGRNRVLNKTDFMKIEITVPTLKEQIKIGNFLDTLQSKIILAEHTLQTLKDQKQAFMQQMFI